MNQTHTYILLNTFFNKIDTNPKRLNVHFFLSEITQNAHEFTSLVLQTIYLKLNDCLSKLPVNIYTFKKKIINLLFLSNFVI